MTLIKTSLLNGLAVLIRMLTLLGINKVLAIYVGPAGYATLGQFQNAVQMTTIFASGAINTGVTKYTAEYLVDEERQRRLWRTSGSIVLGGSLLTAVVLALLSQPLAAWLLKDAGYYDVFVWFALTLPLFTLNALLLAILAGKKDVGRYVVANIAGSLFALVVTTGMTVQFGLRGALVALAIYQSMAFFVTLWLCRRADWFRLDHFLGGIDRDMAVNLGKFTAMALTSAACVPVSHMLIRNYLGTALGWEIAGYWEAMWRLSATYLMLVTTTLGVYYLPRLSELTDPAELRREIREGYRLILPLSAASSVLIYLLRDPIITLLFSGDFTPMRELFAWQMLGDTLKIGSWLLSFLMLSKAMTGLFIILEVTFSAGFVLLTWLFVERLGLQGAAIAHAVTYAVYWVVVAALLGRRIFKSSDRQDPPLSDSSSMSL
jgi:PST family polysaccharide transporter